MTSIYLRTSTYLLDGEKDAYPYSCYIASSYGYTCQKKDKKKVYTAFNNSHDWQDTICKNLYALREMIIKY